MDLEKRVDSYLAKLTRRKQRMVERWIAEFEVYNTPYFRGKKLYYPLSKSPRNIEAREV